MEIKDIDKDLYQEIVVENEDVGSSLIEQPFNPSEIKIDTKSPTLSNIVARLKAKEIDLSPDFQRGMNLWSFEKQSRLIESVLIKFPLPSFYFDGTDDNKWLVVDGLQRLCSLQNFCVDKNLKLKGLEFIHDFEDCGYDSLPRDLKRRIEETQITAYIIQPGTPTEVKYNIFKRINTGGLVLEPQEIRHALNQGKPATFVAQLANTIEFKDATQNKIEADRMLDREFVTRFLLFYFNNYENYNSDLEYSMNTAMGQVNMKTEKELNQTRSDFIESMKLAKEIFGNWAFRISDLFPNRRKPINKALFEVWSVSFAKLSPEKRNILHTRKNDFMNASVELSKNKQFISSVSEGTGKKQQVVIRFKLIEKLIQTFL